MTALVDESIRPWGSYEILQEQAGHKVKLITVTPGKRLSYQRHEKRAEHWVVVDGPLHVTIDGEVLEVPSGGCVDIGIGVAHRAENRGDSPATFVEVQLGTYFGEDDIERLDDDFGRH
jgi:mannose-6-phosphate isomerase